MGGNSNKIMTSQEQINNWNIAILDAINSVSQIKSQMVNQLSAMRNNPDYTEQNCVDLENIIISLNNQISEL